MAAALRAETIGGVLLLAGAVLALVMANTTLRDRYQAWGQTRLGPHLWHLDLPLRSWAADGLLAIFFFVAGLELKRELVVGELRDLNKAVLPIGAAVCGVVAPALVYVAAAAAHPAVRIGWAIPTATDIAFALAVLAIVGSHLPSALRAFLLTLAVVDDLIAIVIIAAFYSSSLSVAPMLGALLPLAAFTVLVQRGWTPWWLLLPLAVATWVLVHSSGIHATVAGVLLGLVVPVRHRGGEEHSLGERIEHAVRPVSAGVAVPLFAFFSAGVVLGGGGLADAVRDPAAIGVALGLVVGKPIGILGGSWAIARFTHAELDEDLAWSDVFGLSLLAGIGFTVSLLIGELAFGADSAHDAAVKVAVLSGSVFAALCAAVLLRRRNRRYRLIHERETADLDGDGVPDVYVQS